MKFSIDKAYDHLLNLTYISAQIVMLNGELKSSDSYRKFNYNGSDFNTYGYKYRYRLKDSEINVYFEPPEDPFISVGTQGCSVYLNKHLYTDKTFINRRIVRMKNQLTELKLLADIPVE